MALPWAVLWRSDLEWLAHLVGIIGFALILLSLLYSLRKRRWLLRKGKVSKWLWLHHLAGFLGGVLALGHSLGNLRGLGLVLALLLAFVLATSALFLLERRAMVPVRGAAAEASRRRKERDRLDAAYRELYARGMAATPEGRGTYSMLLEEAEATARAEAEAERLKGKAPPIRWWRLAHNGGTLLLLGVLLVHIWSKLYFGGGIS